MSVLLTMPCMQVTHLVLVLPELSPLCVFAHPPKYRLRLRQVSPPLLNRLVQVGLKLVEMLSDSTWEPVSVWCSVRLLFLFVSLTILVSVPLKQRVRTFAVFIELTLLPLMSR